MKREFSFTITKIREDTEDVISIFFKKPTDFTYNAGDCIDIGFSDTSLGRKTFSFASSPYEGDLYITYKKGVSSYKKVMEMLEVGDNVSVVHYGSNFIFYPGKKSIFIAGGVGVTPLRSMIYTSIYEKAKEDLILIYLNNSDLFVFFDEFKDWENNNKNLSCIFINTMKTGRISKEMLVDYVPSIKNNLFDFYISGPPLMIDAVGNIIEDLGFVDHIIHTDSFDGYTKELE